jgi:hypothetical protein
LGKLIDWKLNCSISLTLVIIVPLNWGKQLIGNIIVLNKGGFMDAEKKAIYARIRAEKEAEDKKFYDDNAEAAKQAGEAFDREAKKQKGDKLTP